MKNSSWLLVGGIVLAALVIIADAVFVEHRVNSASLPPQKTIDVPYTTQAPTGDWSGIWENACEETSIYMVSSFYQNDPIKRDAAVKRIRQIFQVKNKDFKVSADESLEEIAALIPKLGMPWTTELVVDPTIDDLKQEVAENHPVIVPVYAPALWSKTFKGDGPDYHVMVLVGYDDKTKEFIVNDPGTSNGNKKRFPYIQFMNAIHDLDSKNYKAGKKAVLFTDQSVWGGWSPTVTTTVPSVKSFK